METKWILTMGISFLVLFAAGVILCLASTFFMCEKIDIIESLKESALFAVFPSLVPALTYFVPTILRPFENVLRDTFGVTPDKAPILGLGYIMMLVAWITGARAVGSIQKTVCIPTVDEVAAFKAHFQKKAAKGDADEEKRKTTQT
jgi:hypothetical protein